ncbi:MAG: rhodanese-like domain-containing protein [Bdellovibrionales bacterium]|nr:rhodanese-like domain-containing protein [Bdellovibrionales bacterium]
MKTILSIFFCCFIVACSNSSNNTKVNGNSDSPFESYATNRNIEVAGNKVNMNIYNADLLIDVRNPDEYLEGHLANAINIPHDEIGNRISEISQFKEKKVVVYCRSGRRSGLAKTELLANGFNNVENAGGYSDLVEQKITNN